MKKLNKKRNYNKAYGVLMAVGFILYIGAVAILNGLTKDKEFSEEENRNLETKPKFTIGSFIEGTYVKNYDSYTSDQFAGRNFFVRFKSRLDSLAGNDEKQGVFIGKDSQLLQDFQIRTKEETEAKVQAINSFADSLEGVNTTFMLAPTATKVLEEKLPKYAPVDDEGVFIESIGSMLSENVKLVNPTNELKNNKDKYLYYKTDHHWTTKGAYIAYQELCRALEIEAVTEENFVVEQVTDEFYGSLSSKIGSKNGQPDSIDIYFPKENSEIVVNYISEQKKTTTLYDSSSLEKKDKYEVFTGGNHPHINIKTLGDTSKKLLVIKDSYANSMLTFLTPHYGEIDVIDLRYYMDDVKALVEAQGITDILFLYNVNTFNEDDSILKLEVE